MSRQLIMCIYCSRVNDIEEGLDCDGCGGNLPMPELEKPTFGYMYDSPHRGGTPPAQGWVSSVSIMSTVAMMTTSAW
jgi:hypothetical protein